MTQHHIAMKHSTTNTKNSYLYRHRSTYVFARTKQFRRALRLPRAPSCCVQDASSIRGLGDKIRRGDVTAVQVTESYLDRILGTDDRIGSFITTTAELALQQAAAVDEKLQNGQSIGPLAGIPIAIKDNICLKGTPTTAGSRTLQEFESPYDAAVVTALKAAGAVVIGKTNMDEFGMGSTTETSAFRTTSNPWNRATVPGGSSGGSAAAVAAQQCVAALGSDTGGSIRQPASFCGVVGLKPTYGRVSRHGLMAYASSFDCIGPLASSVEDVSIMMDVISQPLSDQSLMDATMMSSNADHFASTLSTSDEMAAMPLKGVRIGLVCDTIGQGTENDVLERVLQTSRHMEDLGACVEEVSMSTFELGLPAYYILASAEASSNLSRYDGMRYGVMDDQEDIIQQYMHTRCTGFGSEVKRRILMGTYALSSGYYDAYYSRAQKIRSLVHKDFMTTLANFDALLTPAAPSHAYNLGEKLLDPLVMFAGDLMTVNVNLAGLPAVVLRSPCKITPVQYEMPIGIQLIGKPYGEKSLLQIAHALEISSDNAKCPLDI